MATFLNYDDQGFIVGTKRLESGIKSIGEDTQEIIQILKSQNQINQTVLNRIAKSNERIANKKSMRIKGVVPTYDPTSPGRNNASQPSMQSQAQSKQQHRQKLSSTSQPAQKEARAAGRKSSDTLSNVTSSAKIKSGSTLANRANNQSDSGSSGANRSSAGRGGAQSPEAANNAAGSVPGATDASRKANNPTGKNGREKKQKDSDRDELGRFTAKEKTLFDSLSKIAKSGRTGYGSYGGAQNIDPLIASVNEVKDIASPIFNMAMKTGKMGGAAGKAALRAGRFSFSKYKSLKRKEPLPKEQARHNKQNEETLGEILKRMPGGEGSLLGKMGRGLGLLGGGRGKGKGKDKDRKGNKNKGKGIKSILAGGAGAAVLGAGKIGGEGIKKAAKVVGSAKVLGPLATAVGISNLIGQWKELDHKEKSENVGGLAGGSVGAVAGGALGTALIPIPVVGTAIGAAVGGWLGSEGGEVLGSTASPHIKSWTDSVKAYNLPQKMQTKWETGLAPVFSKLSEAAGGMKSWLSRMGGGVSSFFGGGGDGSGGWKVDFGSGLTSAKDGVTYKMGAKNFSGGVIDCSGWVDQLNKDTVRQIEEQLGPEAAKRARINAGNGAAGIIQSEEKKGHLVATANSWAQLDINKLQAGMVIGESRGEHARKEGRYKDIGHIVQIIEENGVKYVSESTSAKGKDGKSGVRKTELSEYIKNLNGRQFGVTVVDPYKELRGQLSGGGAVDVSSSRLTIKDQQAKRDEAMQYFVSQGWTKQQAAGIVGNIQKESRFDPRAQGDKDKNGVYRAHGLAQWRDSRLADFRSVMGKSVQQASFEEQLAFIQYELTKGKEKSAGNRLKKATTADQAGAIVSEFYERPGAVEAEKKERGQIAQGIYNNTAVQSVQQKTKTTNSVLGVNVGGLANNFVAGNTPAYQPASKSLGLELGASMLKSVLNIPDMPSFRLPLAGSGLDKPIIVQSNNDNIGQNVSDRGLAHAITGGLGEGRYWG
ncbi:phage tail tip lysozyme [Psychrobacter sanguinis]|uniref:phage tail tip lysozyme n=1 Tax=Psychrobacter sanguinis TaxID=861445 RepID=UPI0028A86B00|nr:phage tail tip lysozyme [Psychrobacter sanguinis]